MKIFYLILFIKLFIIHSALSQAPLIRQWDFRFGGNSHESISCLKQTSSGKLMMAGTIQSDSSEDVSQHTQGATDFWIIITDSVGDLEWEKRFGGNSYEELRSAVETKDKGYILGGYTNSDSSGDVTSQSKGHQDYWVIKIDSIGNKQWDKRFGGAQEEILQSIQQTTDGGYILGGKTSSDTSVDISQHRRGFIDYWIVKTDALGNKQWDKRFGGNSLSLLNSLLQTNDGGYIFGGYTASDSSGDVSQTTRDEHLTTGNGGDYWIVKTDSIGNKLWDKRFGGNYEDVINSLQQTKDGGYILHGITQSDSSGDVSKPSRDSSLLLISQRGDYWIVKTDSLGNKQWDNRFGGNDTELRGTGNISLIHDGGYLISGESLSNASRDKTENNLGFTQAWIIRTDSLGGKLWDKTIFTRSVYQLSAYRAIAIQSSDQCYIVATTTVADTGGYKTQMSRGYEDFWFIKFCDTTTTIGIHGIDPEQNSIVVFPNPSANEIFIKSLPLDRNMTLRIFNTLGEIMIEKKVITKQLKINVEYFLSGIYFIEITTHQKKYFSKFIRE